MSLSVNGTEMTLLTVNGTACTNLVLNGSAVWARPYKLRITSGSHTNFEEILKRVISTDIAASLGNVPTTQTTCYHGETIQSVLVRQLLKGVPTFWYADYPQYNITGETMIDLNQTSVLPIEITSMKYDGHDGQYYNYLLDTTFDNNLGFDGDNPRGNMFFVIEAGRTNNRGEWVSCLSEFDWDYGAWVQGTNQVGHPYYESDPDRLYNCQFSTFRVGIPSNSGLTSVTFMRLTNCFVWNGQLFSQSTYIKLNAATGTYEYTSVGSNFSPIQDVLGDEYIYIEDVEDETTTTSRT